MDDAVEILFALNVVILCYKLVSTYRLIRRRRRQNRGQWVRGILLTRKTEGVHAQLLPKLLSDRVHYVNYFRMSPETFEHLLSLVGPSLIRVNTTMRKCLSPSERLAVTLRFLASGKLLN